MDINDLLNFVDEHTPGLDSSLVKSMLLQMDYNDPVAVYREVMTFPPEEGYPVAVFNYDKGGGDIRQRVVIVADIVENSSFYTSNGAYIQGWEVTDTPESVWRPISRLSRSLDISSVVDGFKFKNFTVSKCNALVFM